MSKSLLIVIAAGILTAQTTLPELRQAAAAIKADNLLRHIRELSSDAYAGRFPGTEGEKKSVAYLIGECKSIGLRAGGATGSRVQMVPLYGTRSRGNVSISASGKDLALIAGQDYILWSNLPDKTIELRESEIAFAGYGVVAPEYKWDDYAGIDVKGKTVLVLSGDPAVADTNNPSKLDDKWFLGPALTVHGRQGTKLDRAYEHGAAAVILVASASAKLSQNNARENMTLHDGNERKRVRAQALLSFEKTRQLFESSGADFESLRSAAAKPGFRARPLNARASFNVTNDVRQFESANVLARIDGTDPLLKNQYVIYSGHWDHHGQDGSHIFHGASDNAAGTAGVLELARAFRALTPAPKRTLIFLWPTAEEKGLLGSHYYVDHPVYPVQSTVANINLDYFSNWGWGRTKDLSIVGIGNSTLDDLAAEAVKRQGRVLTGDTAPEQGFYFRSDHYEFARAGVPSLETSPGIDYTGKPEGYGAAKRSEYIRNDYHQASDVIKPDWDLGGAVEDLQVLLEVGYRVVQQPKRPEWKADAVWRPRT